MDISRPAARSMQMEIINMNRPAARSMQMDIHKRTARNLQREIVAHFLRFYFYFFLTSLCLRFVLPLTFAISKAHVWCCSRMQITSTLFLFFFFFIRGKGGTSRLSLLRDCNLNKLAGKARTHGTILFPFSR